MHRRDHIADDTRTTTLETGEEAEGSPPPGAETESDEDHGVEVPYTELPPATLRALVEDFVTRDGTDYGTEETPLSTRVEQVYRQLATGQARILFSQRTQTVNIVTQSP